MLWIFRYFWFVCAAVMAVNLVIWRRRFTPLLVSGTVTQREVDLFLLWARAWLVGVPLLLGAIGLAAGGTSPFCASFLAFDTVPRAMVSLGVVSTLGATLWWLWRGNGAELLSRIG